MKGDKAYTVKCRCGTNFTTYPSVNKRFCSRTCYYDSLRLETDSYERHKADGHCPNDGNEAAPGRVQCGRCLLRLRNNWNLKRYGLTPEEHRRLLNEHNGVCAACKKNDAPLCIDHDHVTGRVRGILCKKCNQALGLLQDSAEIVAGLLEYIKKQAAYLSHYKG